MIDTQGDSHRPMIAKSTMLIVGLGTLVYLNSLSVPFLLDDHAVVVNNTRMHTIVGSVQGTARPLTDLTFAINHAVGGGTAGFHAVNIVIHCITGVGLFYLLCICLLQHPSLSLISRTRLATAISLLWVVHPLTTKSVTYIVQRAESLCALFYVWTLYLAIVGLTRRDRRWLTAAVLCCTLGMMTKPVMFSAPLAVLLYDRLFVNLRIANALKKHAVFYTCLFLTMTISPLLLKYNIHHDFSAHAGFGFKELTPFEYALNQPRIILNYLSLVFWPATLCFDYAWPPLHDKPTNWLFCALVTGLLAIAAVGYIRRRWWSFPALCFFMILAPSSSVMPISVLAAEQRMYLPLACVICIAIIALHALAKRLPIASSPRTTMVVICVAIGLLGARTVRRNHDYRSALSIWQTVVEQRPQNPRAHQNLGLAYYNTGELEQASKHYVQSLTIKPDYAAAHNSLGVLLIDKGQYAQAASHLSMALATDTHNPTINRNYADALTLLGKPQDAHQYYEAAGAHPTQSLFAISVKLLQNGRAPQALQAIELVTSHARATAEMHFHHALVLDELSRLDDAKVQYKKTISMDQNHDRAHNNLALIHAKQGQFSLAEPHFLNAIKINPRHKRALKNLANVYAERGQFDQAVQYYLRSLDVDPQYLSAHYRLGLVYEQLKQVEQAAACYRAVLSIDPQHPHARQQLQQLHASAQESP